MDATPPTTFIFNTPSDAEDAVCALSKSGIDVTKLSLIGKASVMDDRPLGFYVKGRSIQACGGVSAFWGAIWGMLYAPAVLQLPGIGLVAMAGPIVSRLAEVLEAAVAMDDKSPLASTLALMGMQALQYPGVETALRAGRYLLMVDTGSRDLLRARATLLALHIPCVA
jgi:hypothetical protein